MAPALSGTASPRRRRLGRESRRECPAVGASLAERHDPALYYKIRNGLYVWSDFRTRIVAKATPVEAGTTVEVGYADLGKNATDAEIEAALPTRHLFDEPAVCAIVAALIARQPEGKEGVLMNNGYANLFYISSCVVRVRWLAVNRGWDVRTWLRDDYGWGAGGRVFSPAN